MPIVESNFKQELASTMTEIACVHLKVGSNALIFGVDHFRSLIQLLQKSYVTRLFIQCRWLQTVHHV